MRALPMKLEQGTADGIDTWGGTLPFDGGALVEIREYSGGELCLVMASTEDDWAIGETTIGDAEVWFYGVRRFEADVDSTFLEKPVVIELMTTNDRDGTFEIELRLARGMGLSWTATHGVVRA